MYMLTFLTPRCKRLSTALHCQSTQSYGRHNTRFIMDFLTNYRRNVFKRYSQVSGEDAGSEFGEENHKANDHANLGQEERSRVWVVLTWFFALMSTYLVFKNWELRNNNGFGTYGGGFDTEFLPATRAIRSIKTRFSGSPRFDETGEEYFLPNSDISVFAGPPSPVVDEGWNRITGGIGGLYFLVTDEEAKQSWGESLDEYWDDRRGGYRAGLDVFHSLHCLNHIRMALYPEYYTQHKVHGRKHTGTS